MVVRTLEEANTAALRYAEQGGNVSQPAAGFWKTFFKSDGLYVIDDANAVTKPFVTQDTGDQNFMGDVAIGYANNPRAAVDIVGDLQQFYSTTTRTGNGVDLYGYWEPSAGGSGSPRALYALSEWDHATNNLTSGYIGVIETEINITQAGNGPIRNHNIINKNFGSGTIATVAGLYVETTVNSGGGTITNDYGIYVEDLTVATNNYSIMTNAGFIVFNESGHAESDIRIETDSEDHFVFVDSGANWMRIGDWDTNYVEIDNGGDMHFVGGGGLPFGHCNGNEIAWTQAAAVQNTWYDISDADMVSGNLHNVTHDGNGQLTALVAGMYNADWSGSFEADATGVHVQVTFSVNGTEEVSGLNHYETTATNKQQSMSGFTILDLAANDTVNVSIRTTDAGAPDLLIDHLMLRINHVGGT